MSLFIKVIDGEIINHPMQDLNLIEAYQLSEITEQFLKENNFVVFENKTFPAGSVLISKDGYELCSDGIVRDAITTREMSQDEKLDDWVRRPRNFFLATSDWTQMADAPLTAEKKAEWAAYRTLLRDMTEKYANVAIPSEITPPVEPT